MVRRGLATACEPGEDASDRLRDATRKILDEYPSARLIKWTKHETVPPDVWIPYGELQEDVDGSERFCTEIGKDMYNGSYWTPDNRNVA